MLNPNTESHEISIRLRLSALTQQMEFGDGGEVSHSHIIVNKVSRAICCNFRSGADNHFACTSVFLSKDQFVGTILVEPDAERSLAPEAICFQSFEQYLKIMDFEYPPDDLSWYQLISLFFDIQFIAQSDDGYSESIEITSTNLDLLESLCSIGDDLQSLTAIPASV